MNSNSLIDEKPQSKTWYLQCNKSGQQFWDDWIHSDCRFMASETYHDGYTPFNPPPKSDI